MDIVENLAKKLFYKVILDAVIKKLIAAVPFLGIPGINVIFVTVFSWFGASLFEYLETSGQYALITFRTEEEKKNYLEQVGNLKKVIDSNPTDEEKKKAIDEYKKKLADLIHVGPK